MQRGQFGSAVLQANTITAASTNSASTSLGGFSGVTAYLNVTAVSGTTPSLAVKLQDSPDGTTWYDIPNGAFTAVTAVGMQRLSVSASGYVRGVLTTTGTTPSFTINLSVVGVN